MSEEKRRDCFIIDEDISEKRCEDRKALQGTVACDNCLFIKADPPEDWVVPKGVAKAAGCSDCGRDDVANSYTGKRCYNCYKLYLEGKAAIEQAGGDPDATEEATEEKARLISLPEKPEPEPEPKPEKEEDLSPGCIVLVEKDLTDAEMLSTLTADDAKGLSIILDILIVLGCVAWFSGIYWLFGGDFDRGTNLGTIYVVASLFAAAAIFLRRK